MTRVVHRLWLVLAGLLVAAACGPGPTPEGPSLLEATSPLPTGATATSAVAATAATEPTMAPTPAPTVRPPTKPPPSPTIAPPASPSAWTGANADVVHVRAVEASDGSWTFHVTVEHPDTGWEDYADGWDVVIPDGTVLKPDADSPFTRLLLHPHVDEQPFTRSQSGIVVPPGVNQVRVRAHDLVDGYGGREVLVDLAVQSGEGFEVERSP